MHSFKIATVPGLSQAASWANGVGYLSIKGHKIPIVLIMFLTD